jgi:hypothetical protein
MAHTKSRYMQDLGFPDGVLIFGPADILASGTNPAVLTNNNAQAPADWSFNNTANTTAMNLDVNLGEGQMLRTGFFEDTQNAFGSSFGSGLGGFIAGPSGNPGSGIPGSAEYQGRPDTIGAMAALQELTPRTSFKTKGIQFNSINVMYSVTGNALTSITARLDKVALNNGAVLPLVPTNLLATGANGLLTAISATMYAIEIPLPTAIQVYQIADLTEYWFRLVVTPSAATANNFKLYGVRAKATFNFN